MDFPANSFGKPQVGFNNLLKHGIIRSLFFKRVIRIPLCLIHIRQVTFGFFHRSEQKKISNVADICSNKEEERSKRKVKPNSAISVNSNQLLCPL